MLRDKAERPLPGLAVIEEHLAAMAAMRPHGPDGPVGPDRKHARMARRRSTATSTRPGTC